MKRIISLLLIVITLSSLLAGCDIGKIWNSGTTTSPTTTTTKEPPIEAPFEHGENLTNDDIKFIIDRLQDQGLVDTLPPPDTLYEKIASLRTSSTLYKLTVDLESEPYFICAYIDPDIYEDPKYKDYLQYYPLPLFSYEYGCNIDELLWHRFDDCNSIPEKIDNCLFAGAFAIFDCVLEDIIYDNTECVNAKYFVPMYKGFLDMDIASEYQIRGEFLVRAFCDLDKENYSLYYPGGKFKHYLTYYSLRKDENGELYYSIKSQTEKYDPETFSFEDCRSVVGEHFDEMLPHLKVIENENNDGYAVCIPLDYFATWCGLVLGNK